MALTPEGTPYVESSDLVANYPAASLSLANRVDLVGVLPFASAAARTTAIPSPTDGQYSYLQDTNTTQFWNGSAWQTAGLMPGLNLVTPTSIANSGGSASATGGAVTFTVVNSVSLNGVFTSGYENYFLMVNKVVGSTASDLNMRLRVAGTDASGSNYTHQNLVAAATTVAGGRLGPITSNQIAILRTSAQGGDISLNMFRPQLAAQTNYATNPGYDTESNARMNLYVGNHSLSTSYDGLTLIPSSGTLTGTIRVYGYQN